MNGTELSLTPARGELGYVERLLDRNGLPTRDVSEKPGCFYVALADGKRVGVGGIEPYDDVGLLRSVVVSASHRGRGFGSALCDALEERAAADGIERLYLLTDGAAGFFAARGYDEIGREAPPPAIRTTAEFETLCPDEATCMRKHL